MKHKPHNTRAADRMASGLPSTGDSESDDPGALQRHSEFAGIDELPPPEGWTVVERFQAATGLARRPLGHDFADSASARKWVEARGYRVIDALRDRTGNKLICQRHPQP